MMETVPATILVIDDEPNIRTGLSKGLTTDSVTVETAADATEGLEKFSRQRHDIVITEEPTNYQPVS